ncbi:S-layer homology domain protein [anaerobic digester metagenome]
MLKMRTILLTVLIMLLSIGTVLAKTSPVVSTSDNKVSITGKSEVANEDITIIITDENGVRQYIDQIESDENGNYSFELSLKDGKYIGKVSTGLNKYDVAVTVKSGTGSEPDDDEPGKPHVPGGSTANKPQEPLQPRKSFADIKSHWAIDEIEILAGKGIISGMNDDYFMPNEKITRAQFAALLFRLLELKSEEYKGMFNDVNSEDWYSTTVESVAKAGIVLGYNDNFCPNKEISREEMAVMIIRALEYKGISTSTSPVNFSDREQISEWALESVGKAVSMGIIKGMTATTFEPKLGATRAQAAVMIYRIIELL